MVITCPKCQKAGKVKGEDELVGRKTRCAFCGEIFTITAESQLVEFEPTPPPVVKNVALDVSEAKNLPQRTKRCPFCAEEISADAIKCKHCGSTLVEAETTPANVATPPQHAKQITYANVEQVSRNAGLHIVVGVAAVSIAIGCMLPWFRGVQFTVSGMHDRGLVVFVAGLLTLGIAIYSLYTDAAFKWIPIVYIILGATSSLIMLSVYMDTESSLGFLEKVSKDMSLESAPIKFDFGIGFITSTIGSICLLILGVLSICIARVKKILVKKILMFIFITTLFGVIAGVVHASLAYFHVLCYYWYLSFNFIISDGVMAISITLAWLMFPIKRKRWNIWFDLLFRIWCLIFVWVMFQPFVRMWVGFDCEQPLEKGLEALGISLGLVVPFIKNSKRWLNYILAMGGVIGGEIIYQLCMAKWGHRMPYDVTRYSFLEGTILALCCAVSWHIAEARGWKAKC